jgi:hypothetical protein
MLRRTGRVCLGVGERLATQRCGLTEFFEGFESFVLPLDPGGNDMPWRYWIRFAFCSVSTCLVLMFPSSGRSSSPSESHQPNVVLITADNLGYGDLGCFGNPHVITPHLDRLSTQGARCTDFYTASPTCTVSRCSLLTGRYSQHHGMIQQLPGIEGNYGVGLSREEMILPRLLNPVGYLTACIGKWNIGFGKGSRPTERGFQDFFGACVWQHGLLHAHLCGSPRPVSRN